LLEFAMKNVNVLVVDGSEIHRVHVARDLVNLGLSRESIMRTGSAEVALRFLREGSFGLVILTSTLDPESMDGFALLRILRTHPDFAALPLIMLLPGGRGRDEAAEERARLLGAKAVDYMTCSRFRLQELIEEAGPPITPLPFASHGHQEGQGQQGAAV
jgi:CheY-like chemotaxis protein